MNELLEILNRFRRDLSEEDRLAIATRLDAQPDLTPADLSTLYGRDKQTTRSWVRNRQVDAFRLDGKWHITKAAARHIRRRKEGRPRILSSSQASAIKHSKQRTTDLANAYEVSPSLVTLIRKGERYGDVG